MKSRGLSYKLVEVPAAATSEDASKSLNIPKSQIAKTIVFVSESKDTILVVVRADRKVDQSKLARLLGFKKLRLAREEEVISSTGYPPGGVPPLGHLAELPVFVDAEIATGEYWCGGGDEKHLVFLDFRRLQGFKGVRIIEVPKKQ